jgi:hypothetical protein
MNTKTLLLCGGGMNKSKRITKLVVETERTFIFRSRSRTRVLWCTGCEKEVEMAPLAEAARQAGLNELALYKLVKERALHFAEGEDGRVLICLNSLSR